MPQTYVIPDIHGRFDLLNQGLAEIIARGDAGVILTIGDYVDKGPESKQVIDRLLSGIAEGWSLVALKGNHDAMMVEALQDPSKMAGWIAKGGDAALASYGGDRGAVPPNHIAWLDGLQLMHVDAHRIYVHAGVDPEIPLDQQSEADFMGSSYAARVLSRQLHIAHSNVCKSTPGPVSSILTSIIGALHFEQAGRPMAAIDRRSLHPQRERGSHARKANERVN